MKSFENTEFHIKCLQLLFLITFPTLVFPYALMAGLWEGKRRKRQGKKAVMFAEQSNFRIEYTLFYLTDC